MRLVKIFLTPRQSGCNRKHETDDGRPCLKMQGDYNCKARQEEDHGNRSKQETQRGEEHWRQALQADLDRHEIEAPYQDDKQGDGNIGYFHGGCRAGADECEAMRCRILFLCLGGGAGKVSHFP